MPLKVKSPRALCVAGFTMAAECLQSTPTSLSIPEPIKGVAFQSNALGKLKKGTTQTGFSTEVKFLTNLH